MIQSVGEQTGTPQDPVDWTDPDVWIDERLTESSREVAKRVWLESDKQLNPRHIYGSYLFINRYKLLQTDGEGIYVLSEDGERFLEDNGRVVVVLDRAEGLDELLSILATKQRAMRRDLLPEWSAFLKENSKFGTASTIKETLRRRLLNLVERGYVDRLGNSYSISKRGIQYLDRLQESGVSDPRRDVTRAVSGYNQAQREELRQRLESMDPVLFEGLIRDLLEAMGYEDVQVTKQSGDKGVDVTGTVQLGISSVSEVVQVKRHKGSIGRPVLDQLRGALPYHKAIRGTIITTGAFSKGCEQAALFPGAAPITLIDGQRLMDLLEEHDVGVQRREVVLIEVDEKYFDATETAVADEDNSADG